MNDSKRPEPRRAAGASRRPHGPLVAGLVLAALCRAASAQGEVDELAADQVSVRELMRLETAQALARLRAGRDAPGLDPAAHRAVASAGGEPSAVRLVAIYGVGRKLMAEVRVDGRTLLFTRGRPEAIGPGRAHAMRLVGITDRCVELAWSGRRESLCAAMPASERD